MTMQREMTDAEITEVRKRAARFIEALGVAITDAIGNVNPASPCADASRRGLARISATLSDVDFILLVNLAQLDEALKRRVNTGLMLLIEAALMTVGTGPEADYVDASEFMRTFEPMVELVCKRRIN